MERVFHSKLWSDSDISWSLLTRSKMCLLLVIVTALSFTVVPAELIQDRTIGGVGSGLSHLLQPGSAQPPLYNWAAGDPSGFTVQSGYEGFVVPTGPAPEPHSGFHSLGSAALGAGLLTALLPFPFNKIGLFIGGKLGLWLVGFLILLLIGGATTTAVCAFTPICTISFLGFGFNRESTRAFFTHDRLNMATQFVYDAIAKYKALQKREGKSGDKTEVKAKKSKESVKESKRR